METHSSSTPTDVSEPAVPVAELASGASDPGLPIGIAISFDPGRTTGYAVGQVVLYRDTGELVLEFQECGEIGWDIRHDAIERGVAGVRWVVVEAFRLYAHKSKDQINSDFEAVQVIGNIQHAVYVAGLDPRVIVYQPAAIKTSVEIKHELGTNSPHAKDAYRHLRYWFIMARSRGGLLP